MPRSRPGSSGESRRPRIDATQAEETTDLLLALQEGGADVIELGVPFTDPMADGATIQVCNEVALKQGVGLERCLSFVRDARADGLTTPVVLMGYYNPFRARAGRAGPASAGRPRGGFAATPRAGDVESPTCLARGRI